MGFKAAGYGAVPDGMGIMSFHAQDSGEVFRLVNGNVNQVGDITLVLAGIKGWNRKACIVLKRMNSIAQTFKRTTLAPNGPGGGFRYAGSFITGASWGDINANDDAIDGVNIFPYGQWDANVTWQEGSYPAPGTPSYGSPYVGDLQQNQFFWEQNINLHTF